MTKEGFRGTDLFVDFASMESYSVRNDRCLFSEAWDSDGSQDELVYNSTEIIDELDDWVIENLFESDFELECEGFVG